MVESIEFFFLELIIFDGHSKIFSILKILLYEDNFVLLAFAIYIILIDFKSKNN